MNDELYDGLPIDLKDHIVRMDKLSNNIGITKDRKSVITTSDLVWAASVKELLGDVDWWISEDQLVYNDIYNEEGTQYHLFSDQGNNCSMQRVPILQLKVSNDGNWWLRISNPYSDESFKPSAFFIDKSGYNNGDGSCNTSYGVVPCFCI